MFKTGRIVGQIPLWRLIIHDWSKFTLVEFINYAQFKYGIKSIDGWSQAWLHHLHHNQHHPEFWVLSWRGDPDFYKELGQELTKFVTVLPMPETFIREFVADMMAVSYENISSYDISSWLNLNGPKMLLHKDSITRLDKVMQELGYILTDNCMWSYMAGKKVNCGRRLSL